jgi:hypothetical protein
MLAELTFQADTHTYRLGGRVVPSVTQILDPLQELDGVPRHVLAAAAEFGTHVHQACDLWNRGQLDEDALDPHLLPYLDGWKRFLRESGFEVMESELRMVHRAAGYAGTCDVVLRNPRTRSVHVGDIKSSATVPRTVGLQIAAYREMYLQDHLVCSSTRYCIHLRGEGRYGLHAFKESTDYTYFLSALNLWRFRNAA